MGNVGCFEIKVPHYRRIVDRHRSFHFQIIPVVVVSPCPPSMPTGSKGQAIALPAARRLDMNDLDMESAIGSWVHATPPRQGSIVTHPGINPVCPLRRLLLLPERRLGFEVIHQKLAGLKALSPMRRAHHHQNDLIQWQQQTDAVNNTHAVNVKALISCVNHGLNRFFSHARIVFQLQAADGAGAASSASAHGADKTADSADAAVLRELLDS